MNFLFSMPASDVFVSKQNTKISGKADEVLPLWPHRATTSTLTSFAPPSSSFCSMSLAQRRGAFAFPTAVRSEHLSRKSITRHLLIYTAAAHSHANSHTRLGGAACTHAHMHRKWRTLRCHQHPRVT